MNKIGINYYNGWNLKYDEQLKMLKEIGYDSFFTGHFTDKPGEERSTAAFAEAAAKYGLCYESIHAPFDTINDIWSTDEIGDVTLKRLTNCVEDCGKFGIPVTVVHLSSGLNPPHINDAGRLRFDKLVECAVKNNVTVAFENQRRLGNLSFIMELYQDVKNVGFCWDVGHEACFARGIEFMPLFGNRLVYTHIHDNTSIFNVDLHMLPYDGNINYDRTEELLAKYLGDVSLTLEVFPEYKNDPHGKYAHMSAFEFHKTAFDKAVKLRERINLKVDN